MYGKLDETVLEGKSNFAERFAGTELEEVGARLDTIIEMHQDGDISKDEAADLIQDIRNEQEVEEMASSMQLRSDFMKACNVLLKVI